MASIVREGTACSIQLQFDVNKKADMTKLQRAEKALADLGIELEAIDADATTRSWFLKSNGPMRVLFMGRN